MNPFNRKETYYKITNEEENHNGLQYHTGRVVDILPFNDNTDDSCVPGGIYFTDKDHILEFGDYGPWVRPLTIPEGVGVILDPDGNKFRAHEVDMQERIPLEEFIKTVDMSRQGGVDLGGLTTLPEGVKFENKGDVDLGSLATLSDVMFENQGYVYLGRLTALTAVKFENKGRVYLGRLTALSDVKFENKGVVYLGSLTSIPVSVSFGKGVTVVRMNRETTNEELSRLGKKYLHVEFERW